MQPLHQFKGYVKDVTGPLGGVQHPDRAQAAVHGLGEVQRVLLTALIVQDQRLSLHGDPIGAQRFDHGRVHQPFDIGAGVLVGAHLVPVLGRQGAFQLGAEDHGFDLFSVAVGGVDRQGRLYL